MTELARAPLFAATVGLAKAEPLFRDQGQTGEGLFPASGR